MSLRTGVSGKNGVEQSPRYLSAQEGDLVTINCNYLEGMTTLQWLQQNPGGSIISLLTLSLEMKKKGRVSATINSRERYSSLNITASQPTDSAIYFCAVETQCSADIWNPYPNSKAERHHVFSSLSFHIHLSLSSGRWDSFDQLKYIPNDAFQKLFKFKIFPLQTTPNR